MKQLTGSAAWVLLFFVFAATSNAQHHHTSGWLKQIVISDSWNSFESYWANYKIVPENGKFYLYQTNSLDTAVDSTAALKLVKAAQIDSLLLLIAACNFDSLNGRNWGITPEYLEKTTARQVGSFAWFNVLDTLQKELFIRKVKDTAEALEALKHEYNTIWSDDYPELEVRFIFPDTAFKIISTAQHPGMLPWVNEKGHSCYDVSISTALHAILPVEADNGNRQRLSTDDLYFIICRGVFSKYFKEKRRELGW